MKKFIAQVLLFSCLTMSLQAVVVDMEYTFMCGTAEKQAIEEISKRFDLELYATGGGAMDVVRTTSVGFRSYRPLSIEEARYICVASIDILSRKINGYLPLRPFLLTYPFPSKYLTFSILVKTPTAELPLAGATLMNDKIVYDKDDPSKSYGHIVLLEESLEEARKQLALDNENPQLKALQEKAKEPFISSIKEPEDDAESYKNPRYIGPEYCRRMAYDFDRYATDIAKKHGMQFHRFGNPTDRGYDKVEYGLIFFDNHKNSLKQARMFATQISRDFYKKILTSECVKDYQKQMLKKYGRGHRFVPKSPAVPEEMCIKIGYWDDNFERPEPPFISEVLLVEGYFNYYEKDSHTQALKLVFKESYEDGMKFLASQEKKSP